LVTEEVDAVHEFLKLTAVKEDDGTYMVLPETIAINNGRKLWEKAYTYGVRISMGLIVL